MATFMFPRIFDRDAKKCQLNKKATTTISQSLHLLILSCYGELLGDPKFGASVLDFKFDRINAAVADALKMQIYEATQRTLKALEIEEDDITISQKDENTITIRVQYTIRNTQFKNMYQEDITNVEQ